MKTHTRSAERDDTYYRIIDDWSQDGRAIVRVNSIVVFVQDVHRDDDAYDIGDRIEIRIDEWPSTYALGSLADSDEVSG